MNKRDRTSQRTANSQKPLEITLSRSRLLWVSAALVVLNFVVYSPVLHHGFVDYDDKQYVAENPHVASGLSWDNVLWALTAGYAANWHPLTWVSHMADVQLYGMRPGPQHLTNLLLHCASTVLLFLLLHSMTGAVGRSAFVAALFAVHPLHVESVAWIAERKDVLSGLLWIVTLWTYVRYVKKSSWSRYAVMVATYALGLMAKPMLVTLPYVLFLLDVWPLRRGVHIRDKLPLCVLAAASSVVTLVVQQQGGGITRPDFVPFGMRLSNAAWSYVAYIGMMLWPARLGAFYPHSRSFSLMHFSLALLFLAAVCLVVIRFLEPRPYLAVGWLWYASTLMPVIGLIQVGEQARADRYTYIPLIGLFIAIAWGMTDLIEHRPLARKVLPFAAVAVVLMCAITARAQVRHWENSTTLWTHASNVIPDNYFAHASLGYVLYTEGKVDEAIVHYQEALRMRNDFAEGHNNFGVALVAQGKLPEAIAQFQEAVRIVPGYRNAQENLRIMLGRARNKQGAALAEQNRIDEAILEFTEGLRSAPENPDLHYNLGRSGKGRIPID